jgi:flagellar basal-body rod modification protein FlgD
MTGITGVPGVTDPAAMTSQASGLGALDGDAFMQLMVAQLKYQNPFEPMDTSGMLQQTAALTTVETLQELAASQRVLMGLQQASVAAGLVGQNVTALTINGEEISGIVEGIQFTADGPMLTIDGYEVPIGNILEMRPPGSEGTGTGGSTDGPTGTGGATDGGTQTGGTTDGGTQTGGTTDGGTQAGGTTDGTSSYGATAGDETLPLKDPPS